MKQSTEQLLSDSKLVVSLYCVFILLRGTLGIGQDRDYYIPLGSADGGARLSSSARRPSSINAKMTAPLRAKEVRIIVSLMKIATLTALEHLGKRVHVVTVFHIFTKP